MESGELLIDRYRIIQEIGRGGTSEVYLAIDINTKKKCTVKAIKRDKYTRISMESQILKKLKNKALPTILDVHETENTFYIIMEYVEGKSLEELMRIQGGLSSEEVSKIAVEVGKVLKYLHSQEPPIIHRDIKPSNIIIKEDGSVALIDFGTAREYIKNKIEDTIKLGTRGYAAPEQFGGMGQTDERTDIYALGVTMYYLLTGKNPGNPPYEMYPVRYWDKSLSSKIENIIIKSTKANPEERYQHVEAFLRDMEKYRKPERNNIDKYKNLFLQKVKEVLFFEEIRSTVLLSPNTMLVK